VGNIYVTGKKTYSASLLAALLSLKLDQYPTQAEYESHEEEYNQNGL